MAGLLALFGFKPKPSLKQLRETLPAIHSFVECVVRDGPKGQICFEGAGIKTITTTALDGMKPGQVAVVSYTNTNGKYSFTSNVVNINGKQATLELPGQIKTLQKFAGARQRNAVRVDTTVNVQWRFTPAGRIATDFQKATLSDLSTGGAQLTVDRELKVGVKVDCQAPLAASGASLMIHGEVRRVDKTRTGKFNAGLRFVELASETEAAIVDFINRRQADLRKRGLA